jgi:hypothetical protein
MRARTCAAVVLALLSLSAAAIAYGNDSTPFRLKAGDRVRLTKVGAANAEPLIGVYRSATAETVEVSQPDPHGGPQRRLSIPVDDLASIEVSRGRSHHTVAGICLGILAGVAAAAAFASGDDEMAGFSVVLFVPVGALTGAFVGGGIGSEHREKIWERPAAP